MLASVDLIVILDPASHANFLIYYSHVASNALRALQGLGLLEAILAKASQTAGPDERLFVFVSGTGDHEIVYDVSFINITSGTSSKFSSMLSIVQETRELEFIGTHIPQNFY